MALSHSTARGPYFEELALGQVFDGAPGVTLTDGNAALHRAITGDRLRLPLDHDLSRRVAGGQAPVAPPALVWDTAIGQSTLATQHVKANLFYRGLVLRRQPRIGDTLRTVTEVVGLRQNTVKPGRRPTGLAALRIRTVDQDDAPVLDFWRCAMLPLGDPEAVTGRSDDLSEIGRLDQDLVHGIEDWKLSEFRERVPGEHFGQLSVGRKWQVGGADVVSSGPELARLTLNIASVHHDSQAAGGQRLVYGGHTIALALAQTSRALPNLVTVVGWHGCDHVAPVTEGDRLTSTVEVEDLQPLPGGGGLVHLLVEVFSETGKVLVWRFVALLA
jgi:acyl dehydratase